MSPILASIDGKLMGTVTLAGISIVFAVLLLLVGVFYLFGFFMRKGEGTKKNKVEKIKTSDDVKQVKAPKAPPAVQVIETGIPGEIVAAISAAVAAAQGGVPYTIKSIKKQQISGRNSWAMAGIIDNTRPF